MMSRHYKITPRLISGFLLAIVLFLLLANLFCVFAATYFGFFFHTMDQFYFNTEGNLPTLFSFVLLLICSVFLWIISEMPAAFEKKKHVYWKALSLIFLFIAVDELISIHETFTDDARSVLDNSASGYLYFAWVVPYAIVFTIVFLLLLRFFLGLPPRTRILFAIAAFTYVMGAIGFEMVAGNFVFHEGKAAKSSLPYMLMVTVEELLEMIGLIIFINALVKYYIGNVADKSLVVTLHFSDQK